MGCTSLFDAELNNFSSCKRREVAYTAAVAIELKGGKYVSWIMYTVYW